MVAAEGVPSMSNRVKIVPTRFEDVRTGDVTFGVRVLDSNTVPEPSSST